MSDEPELPEYGEKFMKDELARKTSTPDLNFLRQHVHGFANMEATAMRVSADQQRYRDKIGYVPSKEFQPEKENKQ